MERLTTGDFIAVSRFDPVVVEAAFGFVALGTGLVSFGSGTAVGGAVSRCLPLGLAPFRPFSLDPEVDDWTHGECAEVFR
jgi:hypothetical protein